MLVFDFEHCLELPGADPDRMLAVHCELMPNLRSSHVFNPIVPPMTLREELNSCLDALQVELASGLGSDGVPRQWREPWETFLVYLSHVSANQAVIIDAALADI